MDFTSAENYLLSLGNEVETMKLGLANIRKLLAALGNPERNYLKVQIAGTNGKGSVCAFLDSICLQAEIKTGVFTSPHLMSITERVRIEGADISEEGFARIATIVRETSEKLVSAAELETVPTYFEQVTAIALVAFAEAKVELAILETGLGGRFDATTAANAEICAITRIDLDHQEYLGETIEEIAAEKAAVITENSEYVVLGEQTRLVMKLLRKHCQEMGIEPLNDEYEPWRLLPMEDGAVKVILSLLNLEPIHLGLHGRHQRENAQTAVQIAKALLYKGLFLDLETGEDEVRIVEGLKKAKHVGRVEYIGNFLLDGAHNVGGANALHAYLDEFVDQPITLVFGAMNDKNVAGIAEILFPKADKTVLTEPSNSRAISTEELSKFVPSNLADERIFATHSVAEAIKLAKALVSTDGIILVTGSLYLVGEVRKILTGAGK